MLYICHWYCYSIQCADVVRLHILMSTAIYCKYAVDNYGPELAMIVLHDLSRGDVMLGNM